MIFFRNDYGTGCIPEILKLLEKANDVICPGYGEDDYCKKAAELIQSKMVDVNADIHFIVSGTLTNLTILKHMLRPYEGVVCCDTGHINIHETGAVEATGHKILVVPNSNGKITAAAVRAEYEKSQLQYSHMVYPKVVYISNTTELGTVYTRKELEELRAVCDEFGLYLFMDGARLGAAIMSGVDYTLNDVGKWCDIFYIGGTKNGALMGEAVVITNEELKKYFRFVQKQTGAMLAKGWLLGIQFIGLFENDAFYKCAKHANDMANTIQEAITEIGYPLYVKSDSNQIFLMVTQEQYDYLKERVDFEIWDTWKNYYIIRFVTSWKTTSDEVDYLIVYLKEAMSFNNLEEEEIVDVSENENMKLESD